MGQPSNLQAQAQGPAGKIKRALRLLFGAANVSIDEVAGAEWVSPDELSGKAEEDRLRTAKGKAKLGESVPGPAAAFGCLSHDSACSMQQQQQQQAAAEAPGVDGRLRQAAATVLGAGLGSLPDAIDEVYCRVPSAGGAPSGLPSHRPSALCGSDGGLELAAVVARGDSAAGPSLGSGSSGGSSGGTGGSSGGTGGSGAWRYAAGPSSSSAAAPSSSSA